MLRGLGIALALLSALPAQRAGAERVPAVAGRVVAAGEPIAGARVVAYWFPHPELPPSWLRALGPGVASAEARTDAAGSFRIPAPPHTPLLLLAGTDDGRISPRRFPVQTRDFVELELGPGSVITGIVCDVGGGPVQGAVVETASFSCLAHHRDRYRAPIPAERTHCDGDGRFRLVVSNAGREGIAHAMRSLRAVDATLASRTPYYRVDGQDLTG